MAQHQQQKNESSRAIHFSQEEWKKIMDVLIVFVVLLLVGGEKVDSYCCAHFKYSLL